MFGISEVEAVTAIFILFLKGAANANAPLTMSATVYHAEGGGLREVERFELGIFGSSDLYGSR